MNLSNYQLTNLPIFAPFQNNKTFFMQTILIAGAGKSSVFLIEYLLNHAKTRKWRVIVADADRAAVEEKTGGHPQAEVAELDVTNDKQRRALVERADIVLSLMPPHLHIHLAKDCLDFKKNLITSSYISPEMQEMDVAAKEKGLMFMCEMGLDPGIDHMTASALFERMNRGLGHNVSFKSYCGGLIAPESDDNPWHYKFTWNPKNIVTAGKDGAHYLNNGKEVTVGYEKLFAQRELVDVAGLGKLAYYPNRDSLHYLTLYKNLPDAYTFMRATFRHPDFCKGWYALVKLDVTNAADNVGHPKTYAEWIIKKLQLADGKNLAGKVAEKLGEKEGSKTMKMLEWLGMFDEKTIAGKGTNSAEILLDLLLEKWAMKPEDKDMVVMQHELEYDPRRAKERTKITSTMIIKGDDREHSAMAKTVGLPIAVLAEVVLTNKLPKMPTGVCIPVSASIYTPVLRQLRRLGIEFHETVL